MEAERTGDIMPRKKKEVWTREQAIKDLIEIKKGVFDGIDTGDQKTVKLAIDVIKELNSICGLKEEVAEDDRGLEVKINVVDKVNK